MFYVMAFVDGRIFWDPALPEILENVGRAAIYDAMNATLAALHGVDIERVGLSDFGKPGNYYERQSSRWTGQYRASRNRRHSRHGPADRLARETCRPTTAGSRWCMATSGWTT